uniref:Uncharacterized protein n=1 Tax=Anguilla anguilla TaxID=7936 RepID=A0A0E9UWJ4_ANGAN
MRLESLNISIGYYTCKYLIALEI